MASSSSTQINNGVATMSGQSSVIANPGHQISLIKLTDSNYLLWKFQILTVIQGHGLEKLSKVQKGLLRSS